MTRIYLQFVESEKGKIIKSGNILKSSWQIMLNIIPLVGIIKRGIGVVGVGGTNYRELPYMSCYTNSPNPLCRNRQRGPP